MIRESVVKIGQPIALHAVATLPEVKNPKVAVLLLNSGVMHRVGACRMSVKIARHIADKLGMLCMRFDFSGLGDSEPRRAGNMDFEEIPAKEVQEVMDFCSQKFGIERFVLYGLCSGAHIACKVAGIDDRIAAIIQVDGYSYATSQANFRYYLRRLFTVEMWLNRFKKLFGLKANPDVGQQVLKLEEGNENFEIPLFPELPEKAIVEGRLASIVGKGIKLHCVFTGQEPYFCYEGQYKDCFSAIDFGDQLSLSYFPDASHIFTQPQYQKQLIDSVVNFLKAVDGVA